MRPVRAVLGLLIAGGLVACAPPVPGARKGRMRTVVGLITAMVLVAGCTAQPETVRQSPSPTATPVSSVTATPRPTAGATPRTELPEVLLDLAVVPPASERPGWITSRVGGLNSSGPTSLAVDRDGLLYLWDQARLRVIVYDKGRYLREIPLL